MMTIELKQLSFHAFHGVYEEEKMIGNTFFVDVSLQYQPIALPIVNLDESINYEKIFEIVAAAMKIPTPLLETVATKIALELQGNFTQVVAGKIQITKQKPPVVGWNGNVSVAYNW
ncbi:MAG TPA: dihydroneopterin aldolase [Phnomibacter sp.]|nr:dihydroneopterin aldolase [Phnomibacter sp.]